MPLPELLCLLTIRTGTGLVMFRGVGQCSILVSQDAPRIKPKRLAAVRDGLIVVSLVQVSTGPCRIGRGIFRIQPDELIAIRNGFLVLTLFAVGISPGIVGRWQISDRAGWPRCSLQWPDRTCPWHCTRVRG